MVEQQTTVLTIDRTTWARKGHDGKWVNGRSGLCNEEGAMCCLGQAAYHLKKVDIETLRFFNSRLPAAHGISCVIVGTSSQNAAININDRVNRWAKLVTDEEQEAAIAAIFLEYGVVVKFIN